MLYKVTSYEVKFEKGKLARLEYVTLERGLSWQKAKEVRRALRKAFIIPEVIHTYEKEL